MKFIIIGSGIVGLSIAKSIIEKKIYKAKDILILDKYSIPSNGTSTHNSGVLHAGLYYKPGSLKAKLSIEGGKKLKKWCKENKLPLLKCGKLLVPFKDYDYKLIDDIAINSRKNGCDIKLLDYKDATKIQDGLIQKDKYLWSPKTSVFSPKLIINKLFQILREKGVEFRKIAVIRDDTLNKKLILEDDTNIKYFKYVNCAGSGALKIAKSVSNKFDHLAILPFIGEYGIQKSGIKIKTNLYPVPDPELPFLGIHLTPRINKSTLIGPNAFPSIRSDIQGLDFNDIKQVPNIIFNNFLLFTLNKQNFRNHALSELTLNTENKFIENSKKFFQRDNINNFKLEMDKSTYGIRAQLIEKKNLKFINDFIFEIIDGNIHIVNAVSPAFTSCFALADFITKRI
tara:strand:+ start:8837 stop:10030 length:1194 start_codon:yes stop_codon:yes gene_type:complete